ncbi:unnamed protein product, partial [Staurois parvus]
VSGPSGTADSRADRGVERQVSGPQAERQVSSGRLDGGRPYTGVPRRSDQVLARDRERVQARQWAPTGTASSGKAVGSESTGMTAGTGSDIGSSDWTAGIGSPGIKSFGSTASTASSGKAVGSESTGMTAGTGSDIESSGWTAGIGSPGIRSFGSTAGTASSGKAVGSES